MKKVAEYSCGPGYNLDGTTERTCQDDGEWDGDAPVCKLVGES